jgi:predicted nucleic acid-binding protein
MALIVDAGALYAQADADDPRHASVRTILEGEREALVTTELAVAEADYLILDRLGPDVELAFLDDLSEGTYLVECLDIADLAAARAIVARYRDLRLGLTDASLVVLAERHASRRLLTFDERAFRAVAPLQGGAFTILPADADSPSSARS